MAFRPTRQMRRSLPAWPQESFVSKALDAHRIFAASLRAAYTHAGGIIQGLPKERLSLGWLLNLKKKGLIEVGDLETGQADEIDAEAHKVGSVGFKPSS